MPLPLEWGQGPRGTLIDNLVISNLYQIKENDKESGSKEINFFAEKLSWGYSYLKEEIYKYNLDLNEIKAVKLRFPVQN